MQFAPCGWIRWRGGEQHILGVVDLEALEPLWRSVHSDGGVDDMFVLPFVDYGTGGEAVGPEVIAIGADGPGVEVVEGLWWSVADVETYWNKSM